MADFPLGPILKVINKEAITRPKQPIVAKGAKVVTLDNQVIGILDFPIGQVDHPYQVIKLKNDITIDLVGKLVVAKVNKKRSKNRNNKRSNN